MTAPAPGDGSQARVVAAATLVGAAVFSSRLAIANSLLVIAYIAAWIAWRHGALRGRPWARALAWPLVAFATVSLVSSLFSVNPLISLDAQPRLLAFLMVPLSALLIDETWWDRLVAGLAVATVVLAVWGIIQWFQVTGDRLEHRITGPLAHYMLYSGWLLLAVLVLLAEVALRPSWRRLWLLGAALLGVTAIGLSLTRNAWIGLTVGLLLLAAVWRRRLLFVYPVLAIVIWVAAPRSVLDRAISTFDLRQQANYDRLCMVVSGVEMIHDYPWTGVGPDMVPELYPLYRRDDAPRWRVPHLHNNLVQIAAERGLPALGIYLWLMTTFFVVTWRGLPGLHGTARSAVAATFVAVAGISVAGLFEYNFWQAVVQYLTLVLMGVGVSRVEAA
ncbi:MAG: O-antigen ligase family protein [Acidobacteriota bacterium]